MERARDGHVCCLQRGDVVGKVPLVDSLAHALHRTHSEYSLPPVWFGLVSDKVQSLLKLFGSV
jgi:hypothetical protein